MLRRTTVVAPISWKVTRLPNLRALLAPPPGRMESSAAAAAPPQPQELPTTLMLSIGEEGTALRKEARCLGVALQDGCRCRHFIAFLFLSLVSICVLVFMNAANAFLLSTRYNVPVDQLGSITSELGVADEGWNIIMLGVWGVASDKIGRARVVVLGLVQVSAALFLFPLGTAVSPRQRACTCRAWMRLPVGELVRCVCLTRPPPGLAGLSDAVTLPAALRSGRRRDHKHADGVPG